MQIEWSEEELLKLAGVGTEAEKEVGEGVGGGVDSLTVGPDFHSRKSCIVITATL